ncbi:MAG: hypothetical protein JWR22_1295 [Herminiimonas sp.]|nr:hypothetical protein [Herminiimonas sp.]
MAKNNKSEAVSPCIAALRIDFQGRFPEREILCEKSRVSLNSVCRALDGISAIVKILYANETERDAQGPDGDLLDIKTVYGLFDALVVLTDSGNADASVLGSHLFRQAKGEA